MLTRHISCESVNSLNSQSSSCSMGSQQSATLFSEKKKKKKNWVGHAECLHRQGAVKLPSGSLLLFGGEVVRHLLTDNVLLLHVVVLSLVFTLFI